MRGEYDYKPHNPKKKNRHLARNEYNALCKYLILDISKVRTTTWFNNNSPVRKCGVNYDRELQPRSGLNN